MILIYTFFIFHRLTAVKGSKETPRTEYGKNCSVTDSGVSSCPGGWNREGEQCFLWVQEEKTWEEAEDFCKQSPNNAHLVSVTTSDIYKYIKSNISSDTWIGATNLTENAAWVWTDCSSFNSEPKGNESCVHLTVKGSGSNDKKCKEKLKFVCSKKLSQGGSVV